MRSIHVLVLACAWGFAAQAQEVPSFDVQAVVKNITDSQYPPIDKDRCEGPLTEVFSHTDFSDRDQSRAGDLYLQALKCTNRYTHFELVPYDKSPLLGGGSVPSPRPVLADEIPAESWEIMPSGGTLYLRVRNFLYTVSEFEDGLRDLRAMKGGLKRFSRIVVDLRGNRGGYLDRACFFLSWFPGMETAKSYLEDNKGMQSVWPNCDEVDSFASEAEIAVLVDEETASAAEFIAAVLEERGAILIGSRTFGKGVGQTLENFGPLDAYITSFEFHYSTGATYHGRGIEPHVQDLFLGCGESMLCLLSHVSTDLALYRALAGSVQARAAELQLQTAVAE